MSGRLPMVPENLAGRWSARNAAAVIFIGPTAEEEAAVCAVAGDDKERFFLTISCCFFLLVEFTQSKDCISIEKLLFKSDPN